MAEADEFFREIISNGQRGPIPSANFVGTVYHGAPLLKGPGVEFIGEIDERQKTDFLDVPDRLARAVRASND
jgi:hypothetical protein